MTAVTAERKNTTVSEGVHTFKIIKSEEKEGKTSGEPYWNFTCQCQDEGPDKGLSVWLMISLSQQARFKVDQFFDAMGVPDKGMIDHPQCVGKTFRSVIEWDEFNGSLKANMTVLIPFGKEYVPKPKAKSSAPVANGFIPQEVTTEAPAVQVPGAIKPPF